MAASGLGLLGVDLGLEIERDGGDARGPLGITNLKLLPLSAGCPCFELAIIWRVHLHSVNKRSTPEGGLAREPIADGGLRMVDCGWWMVDGASSIFDRRSKAVMMRGE